LARAVVHTENMVKIQKKDLTITKEMPVLRMGARPKKAVAVTKK